MNKPEQRICVIGLGYIGLPTACLFAQAGFRVFGVDINPEIVKNVNVGDSHLTNEPNLSDALKEVVRAGRLTASIKPDVADCFFICVPTPFKEDHLSDLTYVETAIQSILPFLKKGDTVILESTSPPGTTATIIGDAIRTKNFKIGEDIFVAYCPERVMPGKILRELKTNSRIIGGLTPDCAKKARQFYHKIVDAKIFETSARVAEVVKLVENSYRDVNVAFANEISMLCAHLDIPHAEVIQLANHHPRVDILTPGPGVGGHCIAVDPWFLVEAAPKQTTLIRAARRVNLEKTHYVVNAIHAKVSQRFKETGIFQRIYLFGMTYKADVADFRESPAIEIYHALAKEFGKMARVFVVDPFLTEREDFSPEKLPAVALTKIPEEGKDVIHVRLVAHKEFANLSFTMDFSN
ncbi:MAG: hypothetical protein A3H42_04420 [Deltaproteobacteria bacterium RIFCSPLOWO2_02_FULL_46_8]|nr:MAG: hypothetical protein A3H42_04420 [Deltaproteobacteria bacterium RIFCSPLOWO2_02_FULL_46_8]